MKFLVVLSIVLAFSVYAITAEEATGNNNGTVSDNGADNTAETSDTENGGEPANTTNSDTGDNEQENTGTGAGSEGGSDPSGADADNTVEGGNVDNSTTTKTTKDKMNDLIMGLPAKCGDQFDFCYSNDSTVAEIKGTALTDREDDEICEALKKGESCLTTARNEKQCTSEEYIKAHNIACSATRGVAVSIFLLAFLNLFAKILSQH